VSLFATLSPVDPLANALIYIAAREILRIQVYTRNVFDSGMIPVQEMNALGGRELVSSCVCMGVATF